MTSKLVRHFWVVILVLITACGKQVGRMTPTILPTSTSNTSFAQSLSPIPVSPTLSITSAPSSLSVAFPPDGLRMAYIINGNLHFQEGSNPAVQRIKD
jgi:hypothetical protein